MAVSKARKSEQLASLEAVLRDAKSIGFASYQKVTVAEVTMMKKELRAQSGLFLTAKKTLIRIAFQNVYGVEVDIETLPGQVALVVGNEDPISPLGIVNKYATQKDWKKVEKLQFVGGYFEGKLVDGPSIQKIASLPSREVLLAKLLGSMMSPLSGLARFFDAAKNDIESKGLAKVGDLTVATPVAPAEAPAPVESPSESTTAA